jgi:aerotolerance regulator-like protein/VWA domain-containing protein
MSFLAPLFLLGAVAVALPVIFHLIRRTTRERTVFSSLLFLLPTPPRVTRRSRLENLLLLALRCAALCLLALGFARPFLKRPVSAAPPSGATRTVVLLDTSASMRRGTLWSEARDKVRSILNAAAPADQVALFTFDRQVQTVVSFEQWIGAPIGERVGLALGRLQNISPGWSATHLGDALIRAAEALADNGGKPAAERSQVVVIADLQEGSHLEPLQGYEWPKGLAVSVEPLKVRRTSNAALQRVADSEELGAKSEASIRVRVSNCPDSRREQFKVCWMQPEGRGFATKPIDVYVPPGQSRILAVPIPANGPEAHCLLLEGDEEPFDNSLYVIPPEPVNLGVLYLGLDSEQDPRGPLYFLRRAFQDTRRQTVQVVARSPGQPLLETEVQTAGLIILADPVSDQSAGALRAQVAAGKSVLCLVKSPAMGSTLEGLLGGSALSLEEAAPSRYAMLAEIDFRHPLFAPFADPRFSDFTKVHFWKYRRLDPTTIPAARVLAKFDSGDPALLEVPVGKGRMLILTSGWQPQDSQLALSTKFVPLLYSLLEQSGLPDSAPLEYRIGDTVPLGRLAGTEAGPIKVQLPDNSQLNLSGSDTNFSQTMVPGIYSVTSSQPPRRFAVNLDPAESRTGPLPPDELERLGVPMARTTPSVDRQFERTVRLQSAQLESRQKLWRWLILGALGVLLAETWLAGWTARHATLRHEGT